MCRAPAVWTTSLNHNESHSGHSTITVLTLSMRGLKLKDFKWPAMGYTARLWPASFRLKDPLAWSQVYRQWAIWTKLLGLVSPLHRLPPFQFYAGGPRWEIEITVLIQSRFKLGEIGLKYKSNSVVFRTHTDRNQAGKGTWGRPRGLWPCKGHPLLKSLKSE